MAGVGNRIGSLTSFRRSWTMNPSIFSRFPSNIGGSGILPQRRTGRAGGAGLLLAIGSFPFRIEAARVWSWSYAVLRVASRAKKLLFLIECNSVGNCAGCRWLGTSNKSVTGVAQRDSKQQKRRHQLRQEPGLGWVCGLGWGMK
jgi:hypothetical protein